MKDCTATFDSNSKALDREPARTRWIFGARPFNEQRPHEALGMRCPSQLYHSSSRKYHGPIEELIYPQMANRRINRHGQMSWENELYFLSTSLAGWSLGLKDTPEGRIEVWFARLLLGWIDPTSASFLRADIPRKKQQNKAEKT
jgi:hypothetical protein